MLPGTDRATCLIVPLASTTIWVLMVSAFFLPEYPEPVFLRSVLCSVASTTSFRISSSRKSVFLVGISNTDSTTGRNLAKYLQIARKETHASCMIGYRGEASQPILQGSTRTASRFLF